MERLLSAQIEQSLNLARDVRDAYQELLFHAIYAHPIMRMVGAQAVAERNSKAEQNLAELPEVRAALAKLENGSEAEGAIRILELLARTRSYVRRSHLERATRVFEDTEPFCSMTDTELAAKIHEQALIVQFAPEAALNTLPVLLDTMQERTRALNVVMEIAGPFESMHPDVRVLYREIEAMLLPARAAVNMQPANSDLVPSSEENDEESAPFLYHQAPTQPDDLILIKGIGPKLNKLLNQIGIYTFAQIAAWTEAEVAWVNEKIDFPGRIQREEWISQARALNVEKHAAE
jgi:predicted flap endonuclease-1-like 5' DNA nuclease